MIGKGTISISGGTIYNSNTSGGYAIHNCRNYPTDGILGYNITGGSIYSSAGSESVAIYVSDDSKTLINGSSTVKITGCKYAIHIYNSENTGSQFLLYGGTITSLADSAIYSQGDATLFVGANKSVSNSYSETAVTVCSMNASTWSIYFSSSSGFKWYFYDGRIIQQVNKGLYGCSGYASWGASVKYTYKEGTGYIYTLYKKSS